MPLDSSNLSKLCPTSKAEVDSWNLGVHLNKELTTPAPNNVGSAMVGGTAYSAEGVTLSGNEQVAQRALDSGKFHGPSLTLPAQQQQANAGVKFDAGKAPIAQAFIAYFPRAIQAVANISAFGAKKYNVHYSDQNWSRVDGGPGRYEDALARHSKDHLQGELYAQDSKLLHAAHRAWNALATLELILRAGTPERDSTD